MWTCFGTKIKKGCHIINVINYLFLRILNQKIIWQQYKLNKNSMHLWKLHCAALDGKIALRGSNINSTLILICKIQLWHTVYIYALNFDLDICQPSIILKFVCAATHWKMTIVRNASCMASSPAEIMERSRIDTWKSRLWPRELFPDASSSIWMSTIRRQRNIV